MMDLIDPKGLTLGSLFVSSFVIGLSGAVMPGPILAVAITHSARQGAKAGPELALGHSLLEAVLVFALVMGLGPFLSDPVVSGIIGGVGACILLWMAIGMIRSLPSLTLDLAPSGNNNASPFKDGIILSISNPYWSVWWATVGLSLMAVAIDSGLGLWGVAAFYFGHISSDIAWFSLVSTVVAKSRTFITDKVLRYVVGVCAVFLIVFAGYFGWFAIDNLMS